MRHHTDRERLPEEIPDDNYLPNYRDIVECQTELIMRFLPDGTIRYANHAFYKLFGSVAVDKKKKYNFFRLIPKSEKKRIDAEIINNVRKEQFGKIEHWIQLSTKEKMWLRWNLQPIYRNDELIEIQAFGTSTTSGAKAYEELRESEEKIKALINAPTDTAILMTTNWKVLAINHVGAKRFGYSVEALIDQFLYNYIPPDVYAFRKPKFEQVRRSGQPVQFEDIREGRVLESHVYPLFDKKGNVDRFAVFTRDITERKKAFELLQKKEAELRIKASKLEDANIALKVLIKNREDDKNELEEKIWFNIKELVLPYLDKLMNSRLNDKQMFLAKRLERSINEILSPLARKMSLKYGAFTPTEIQVANLIQQGLTTKDIARFFRLSERTIEYHRENIRRKLGLKYKKTNLKTYLLSHEL